MCLPSVQEGSCHQKPELPQNIPASQQPTQMSNKSNQDQVNRKPSSQKTKCIPYVAPYQASAFNFTRSLIANFRFHGLLNWPTVVKISHCRPPRIADSAPATATCNNKWSYLRLFIFNLFQSSGFHRFVSLLKPFFFDFHCPLTSFVSSYGCVCVDFAYRRLWTTPKATVDFFNLDNKITCKSN